jgi:hypothetical protein
MDGEMHDIAARHGGGVGLIINEKRHFNRFCWAGNGHPGVSPHVGSDEVAPSPRHG